MSEARPRGQGWSRRAFLAGCSAFRLPAASRRGAIFPSEAARFPDGATEFPVLRLTNPSATARLPGNRCRVISRRRDFLVYASDRTGSFQLFRLDLKSGASRLLTEATALDPADFALLEGDRACVHFDGRRLVETALGNLRDRVLYETGTGFERAPGLSVAPGGRDVIFIERREGRSRLRRLELRRRRVTTIMEGTGSWRDPQAAPRRAGILFRDSEDRIWTTPSSSRAPFQIRPPDGRAGPACLSPGGHSVLYLHYPDQGLHALREYFLSTRQDRLIARTSQFVGFAPNGDASVFVGASTGRAMPYILLMLRANGRELPLCEHRSSDPRSVRPVFSPDSRQIFFESDRDGRPALFAVPVETLVEATEQE